MAEQLLMPKATAVWLVDNTSLSFDQIADFCKLHPLEVKAIADGEAAQGIKGLDPVSTGQLTRDDLEKAQKDSKIKLKLQPPKVKIPSQSRKRPRYTPVSKRQDRPNAIRWLLRNHPELKDAQVIRLVGTTKNTIEAIREGSHWNAANLQPIDPVTLGLCTQISLDMEVAKANKNRPKPPPGQEGEGAHLLSADQTQDPLATEGMSSAAAAANAMGAALGAAAGIGSSSTATAEEEVDAESVFSKFTDDNSSDEVQEEETINADDVFQDSGDENNSEQ